MLTPSFKSVIAVTAALCYSSRVLMLQLFISQITIELHPWSLPDAKYFWPSKFKIAKEQMLALCPLKLVILEPFDISYIIRAPSFPPTAI
jgi:hypothetical protein